MHICVSIFIYTCIYIRPSITLSKAPYIITVSTSTSTWEERVSTDLLSSADPHLRHAGAAAHPPGDRATFGLGVKELRFLGNPRFPWKGSFKGDIDILIAGSVKKLLLVCCVGLQEGLRPMKTS